VKRKPLKLPDPDEARASSSAKGAFVAFGWGDDDDYRDPSQPVGYDAQGRPLYAPARADRIFRFPRWPWR
jgi:hypothetical protein